VELLCRDGLGVCSVCSLVDWRLLISIPSSLNFAGSATDAVAGPDAGAGRSDAAKDLGVGVSNDYCSKAVDTVVGADGRGGGSDDVAAATDVIVGAKMQGPCGSSFTHATASGRLVTGRLQLV
jgi:hypothetical protein